MKKEGRNTYAFKYEKDRTEAKKEKDQSWKGQKEDACQAIHTRLPHTCREGRITAIVGRIAAALTRGAAGNRYVSGESLKYDLSALEEGWDYTL
jgi:hypothetical protein